MTLAGMADLLARRFSVGLIVGFAGVALLFHDLVSKPLTTTLWGNDLDPHLIVWTVEWGYHTAFERWAPLEVWDANSYFPYLHSLAFSDSLLLAQLLYAPLRSIGLEPLLSLYLTMVGLCLLGTMLTDWLLHDYGFTASERALTVVSAHFVLPMTAFMIVHFQLFGMQLAPPFLLALHRLITRWRGRDLVVVTALFCAAGGFATYAVPMLSLIGAFVVLIFSVPLARCFRANAQYSSLGWKSPTLSGVILALFFIIQLRPYLSLFSQLPSQSMSETYTYSARPWSVLLDVSASSFWYRPRGIVYGYWERAAFPGIPLLLAAALGVLAFLRRAHQAELQTEAKAKIPLMAFAITVFGVCWILSWGPYLKPCLCSNTHINLPFLALAKVIPGVQNIRAPGRFAQFYGLPLGLLAVSGIRWGFRRWPFGGKTAAVALSVVVLIDQMPRVDIYPFAIAHADFFRAAKPVIVEGEPVIILPIAGTDYIETWSNRVRQLESSTIDWPKLVTGAGSRDTPEQNDLINLDNKLRNGTGSLADIAAYARSLGIDKLVIFPSDYPQEARTRISAEAQSLVGRIILKTPEGMVVLLSR